MKLFPFLIPFLILETLVQIAMQGYFAVTGDPSPLLGYISFVLTAILLATVVWLAARRGNNVRSGMLAGSILWIYAGSLTVLFAYANYLGLFGSAVKSSRLEFNGDLISLALSTPIAVLVCWAIARIVVQQRQR